MMKSRWMAVTAAGVLVSAVVLIGKNDTVAQSTVTGVDLGKVAVVDMTKVFNECQQIKDINDILQRRGAEFRTQIQKSQETIEQKEAELEAFARGSKEYVERFKEWVQLQVDYATSVKVHQRKLLRNQTLWTRKTYYSTVEAVEELAKARGLSLVLYRDEMELATDDINELERRLRSRKVIYSAAALDITQEILDKVDGNYKAAGGAKALEAQY